MTIYKMSISKELQTHSLTRSDRIEIDIETNNKKVLDFFDAKIKELLSEEHYLDYLNVELEE